MRYTGYLRQSAGKVVCCGSICAAPASVTWRNAGRAANAHTSSATPSIFGALKLFTAPGRRALRMISHWPGRTCTSSFCWASRRTGRLLPSDSATASAGSTPASVISRFLPATNNSMRVVRVSGMSSLIRRLTRRSVFSASRDSRAPCARVNRPLASQRGSSTDWPLIESAIKPVIAGTARFSGKASQMKRPASRCSPANR